MGSEKTNNVGNTVWGWEGRELDLTEAEAKSTSTQARCLQAEDPIVFMDLNEIYSPPNRLHMLRNKR